MFRKGLKGLNYHLVCSLTNLNVSRRKVKRTVEVEIPDGDYCEDCLFVIYGECKGADCRFYMSILHEVYANNNWKAIKCDECKQENK